MAILFIHTLCRFFLFLFTTYPLQFSSNCDLIVQFSVFNCILYELNWNVESVYLMPSISADVKPKAVGINFISSFYMKWTAAFSSFRFLQKPSKHNFFLICFAGDFICSVYIAAVYSGIRRAEASELNPQCLCYGKGKNDRFGV